MFRRGNAMVKIVIARKLAVRMFWMLAVGQVNGNDTVG